MSFIVKGINMPKECRAVEIKFYIPHIIHPDNIYMNRREMLDQEISVLFTAEHLNDIIQIPKGHGRLKDDKEILARAEQEVDGLVMSAEHLPMVIEWILDKCDTILEAEE